MALGNLVGRARISRHSPRAMGICDCCGFAYNLDALRPQMQWAGMALRDTGFRVCRRCQDKPQDQLRSPILPPDPVPRENPRPDVWATPFAPSTTPGNHGFTVYVLRLPTRAAGSDIGAFAIGESALPALPDVLYPTDKSAVLAAVAALSGIATPTTTVDHSALFARANIGQTVMPANERRTWLLLYSPVNAPIAVSFGLTAYWGAPTNMMIGPGEALFWAATQGLGAVFQGVVSAVTLQPGMQPVPSLLTA